jgi:hypothetical protein
VLLLSVSLATVARISRRLPHWAVPSEVCSSADGHVSGCGPCIFPHRWNSLLGTVMGPPPWDWNCPRQKQNRGAGAARIAADHLAGKLTSPGRPLEGEDNACVGRCHVVLGRHIIHIQIQGQLRTREDGKPPMAVKPQETPGICHVLTIC